MSIKPNRNIYKPFMSNRINKMAEIKKVLQRNKGPLMIKYIIVPRKSNIQVGDYVSIQKIKLEVSSQTA
jgi:hypothetical protein